LLNKSSVKTEKTASALHLLYFLLPAQLNPEKILPSLQIKSEKDQLFPDDFVI